MSYSIGEVSRLTGLPISTLRYYDREGMFADMQRTRGGVRVFSQRELSAIRVIACLKSAGMSVKEIRDFLGWCQEGDASLKKRRDMIHRRLEEVERQMRLLQSTMNTLKYKCWYYDTAVEAGTEDAVKDLPDEAIPQEFRDYRI